MNALPVFVTALLVVSTVVGGAVVGQHEPVSVDAPESAVGSNAASPDADPARTRFEGPLHPSVGAPNGSAENVTRVLIIPAPSVARSGFARQGIDLGPGLAIGTNVTEAQLQTRAIRERIRSADEDERVRILREELRAIEERVEALKTLERRAIREYSEGSRSAESLVVRLAKIDAEADALEARLSAFEQLETELENVDVAGSRIDYLEFRLQTFDGPVREQTTAILRGQAPPSRIFVETGPNSVVMSTIVNGSYVREASRGPLRDPAGGSLSLEEAKQIISRSYPEIWAKQENGTFDIRGTRNLYIVQFPHERGQLTAFLSGGTNAVFKEFQRLPLSSFDNRTAVSNVRDGLRLTVNRTFPGGPLKVTFTDIETGEPVDATIKLNQGSTRGAVLGRTGPDGVLWTLSPRGVFTVTAIRTERLAAVPVTTRPVIPTALADGSTGNATA
jgi:hypothetical protein